MWNDINTVHLDDGHNMSIDGESVRRVARERNEAHAVAAVWADGDDRERNDWAASIATLTVDESGDRRRGGPVQRRSRLMIPVRQGDDGVLVINIVAGSVWVKEIVDDHRTAKTIAVLRQMVRMVPEGSCVPLGAKLVHERVARSDGALGDTSWTVCPSGSCLKETVPVNTSGAQHRRIRE